MGAGDTFGRYKKSQLRTSGQLDLSENENALRQRPWQDLAAVCCAKLEISASAGHGPCPGHRGPAQGTYRVGGVILCIAGVTLSWEAGVNGAAG